MALCCQCPGGRDYLCADIVGVDRIFMVGLRMADDAPDVKVDVPTSVVLFDQTRAPFQGGIRRFYFRAVKPSPKADIRFALPSGEVVVPVMISSFDDLRQSRTLKGERNKCSARVRQLTHAVLRRAIKQAAAKFDEMLAAKPAPAKPRRKTAAL